MHPVLFLTIGMMGAAALARWCVKEVHRIHGEFDSVSATMPMEPVDRAALPKLKRDPATGVYRPG